ncbi:hypothetical protein DBR42_27705 [Pelomonas sp. HMWF004]|nr:hypothetical protein DBR42_27705 [Pelomonas sp. HMWF004]
MHLRSLEIQNLRVFKQATLAFPPVDTNVPYSNVHLFLGTNGSGKTSLLRAIVLAALGPILPSSGMRPFSLVRRMDRGRRGKCVIGAAFSLGKQDGRSPQVRSTTTLQAMAGFNDKLLDAKFAPAAEKPLWDDDSPAYLVLGYGATRLPEPEGTFSAKRDRSRMLRYQRIAGLFEEYVPLRALRNWLPQYHDQQRHAQVVDLINELLQDVNVRLHRQPVDDEYLFEIRGSKLPLSALSDGYRAYVGWISDLLCHLCESTPPTQSLRSSEGIVLIDEIDLHLHPQWQRVIIDRLSKTFPQLQFFVTSHSPLIAGTLPAANTFIVQGSGKQAVVIPSPHEVFGWSADQILSSPLFAETPPRNARAVDVIRTTSVKARKGDRQAAMDLMGVLADGIDPLANAPTAPRVAATGRALRGAAR